MGFVFSDSSSSDSKSEPDLSNSSGESNVPSAAPLTEPTQAKLISLLQSSSFNWFELIHQAEMQKLDVSSVEEKFEALLGELSPEEGKLVSQSHDAYLHMEKWVMPEEEREAAAMNGDVVSESEVENPDSYLKANSDTPEDSLYQTKGS